MNRPDVLKPSMMDDVAFPDAVESRFLDLCAAYKRTHGSELLIPSSLDPDILRWRTLRVRHKKGDFRHTEAEMKSTKTIAQWLLDNNADLRNQPRKILDVLKA